MAENSKHGFPCGFCVLGTRCSLIWWLCLRVLQAANRWGCSCPRAQSGEGPLPSSLTRPLTGDISSSMAATFPRAGTRGAQKPQPSCSLVLEGLSHHLCILLTGMVGQPHPGSGKDVIASACQDVGSQGAVLEVSYHSVFSKSQFGVLFILSNVCSSFQFSIPQVSSLVFVVFFASLTRQLFSTFAACLCVNFQDRNSLPRSRWLHLETVLHVVFVCVWVCLFTGPIPIHSLNHESNTILRFYISKCLVIVSLFSACGQRT